MHNVSPARSFLTSLLLIVCLHGVFPFGGCMGEHLPDPAPDAGTLPQIDDFSIQSGGSWVPTNSGNRGSIIGVNGTGFGQDVSGLTVTYNGVQAEVLALEQNVDTQGRQRIVTVVPEKATTGPVVVSRYGLESEGVEFHVILVVASATINDILVVPEGEEENGGFTVWLATQPGGLVRFDGSLDSLNRGDFVRYTTAGGMLSNHAVTLLRDDAGRILVGTYNGGLNIKTDTGFVNFTKNEAPEGPAGLPGNQVHTLYSVPRTGDLLVGTVQGLAVWPDYETTAGGVLKADNPIPPWKTVDGLGMSIEAILPDPQDDRDLLIATMDGLYRLTVDWASPDRWENPERQAVTKLFPNQQQLAENADIGKLVRLAADGRGGLFAGTGLSGLLHFDRPGDYSNMVHYKDMTFVHDILESSGGNRFYVATTGGLYEFLRQESGFTRIEHGKDLFASMALTPDGTVYLGTDRQGLQVFEEGENGPRNWDGTRALSPLRSNGIQCLAPDGDGGVFIGTRGGGLNRLHGNPEVPTYLGSITEIEGIQHDQYVGSLAALRETWGNNQKQIWVGTGTGFGLLEYSGSQESYTSHFDNRSEPGSGVGFFMQILPLENEGVLLAPLTEGLLLYSGREQDNRLPWRNLSRGVNFEMASGFVMEDVTMRLPLYPGQGGSWFQDVKLTDFSLNANDYRPAAGTLNHFSDRKETTLYGYFFFDHDTWIGTTKAEGVALLPFLYLKGKARGLERPGGQVTLEFSDWLYGVESAWLFRYHYAWDPDAINMSVIARSQDRADEDDREEGFVDFSFHGPRSGIFFLLPLGPHFSLPIPLGAFNGSFSAAFDSFPVSRQEATPTWFITSLMQDSDGNILVGTQEDGLFIFRPDRPATRDQHFRRIQGDGGELQQVSALALDRNGALFVGTFSHGVYRVTDYASETESPEVVPVGCGSGSEESALASPMVSALEVTDDNRLLVAVWDHKNLSNNGITVLENDTVVREHPFVRLDVYDGLIPARIQDMLIEGDDLYLGTAEGLCIIAGFSEFITSRFEKR